MSQAEADDSEDFDVVNIDSDSEPEAPTGHPDLLLQNRLFLVSTARVLGGHRPSCTFEGQVYEVASSADGASYLQRVLEPTDNEAALSLSVRYEPPSPKFSSRHPESTSYRVKLLQGPQFIYLHRGLPKVCYVDRTARCLSWGALQLVMRDAEQLDSVLAVLKHTQIQETELWPSRVSQLWLGIEGAIAGPSTEASSSASTAANQAAAGSTAAGGDANTSTTAESASTSAQALPEESFVAAEATGSGAAAGTAEAAAGTAEAEPVGQASEQKTAAPSPRRWSLWTSLAQTLFPSSAAGGPTLGGTVYGATLLLSAAVVAAVLWRMHHRKQRAA